ncbi:terminal uridylyltransferase, partial [Tremellales sp. Uapishka_1]
MHPGILHRRFLVDLSASLSNFVIPMLPTHEELTVKEEVRALIEKLIRTIEPSAELCSFGSSCNSFGLRNSDMDLVVLIKDPEANLEPHIFVQMIGDLLERETNFDVKPLPRARIPIIKLNLAASPGLPFGIACDIGFENRLAIQNTKLLLTYATIDPGRVRTLVLFLKVWAKRRKINSPYRGTLSSYGITLMVLYFLVHVKNPPVLPNLQRIAPLRPMTREEMTLDGRDVWFFSDVETLRQEWSSVNFESVGELLIDFFRYFSHDFQFNNAVLSIRAGQLTKESKGWMNDIDVGGLNEMARDRNRLCIEDPFETTYNVARTVTKDGLYTIRGEFMRATRILSQRPERALTTLNELCRDREDELHRAPRSASPAARSLSVNRNPYSTPIAPGWRSQSQAPFDRPLVHAPSSASGGGRRGRQSDTTPGANAEFSAQELWLASQGANVGGPGLGSLGLGFDDPSMSIRGRDTATRGLEGNADPQSHQYRNSRRTASAYDANGGAGSGSISAPLSPSNLYNQKQLQAVWQGYRQMPPLGMDPPTTTLNPPSPLPAFEPFSPAVLPNSLRPPVHDEPYISPSTLLSPNPAPSALPHLGGLDSLTQGLGNLGLGKKPVKEKQSQPPTLPPAVKGKE